VPEVYKEPGWTWSNLRKLVQDRNQAEISRLFDYAYDNLPYPTKLPGGRVEVRIPNQTSSAFRLELATAEGNVKLNKAEAKFFIPANEKVVVGVIPSGDVEVNLRRPAAEIKPGSNSLDSASIAALGYPEAKEGQSASARWFHQQTTENFSYCVYVAWKSTGNQTLIAATISTSKEGDPVHVAEQRIRAALSSGYARLLVPHKKWWANFWSSSYVKVPDEEIQKHYDLCKYFYGSASRRGAPPMPLQGIWTADAGNLPPWKGDFHNDLNTQTSYIAYQTAGLNDSGNSFLDFMWDLLPQFRSFAKTFYGVPGAVLPGVMDLEGKPMGGWGQYSLSPTNGAWTASLFARHWRVTQDQNFLRYRAYPWCKEIGRALENLLVMGKDGLRRLPLSSSPEFFDNSLQAWLPPNSNYDTALMSGLYKDLQEMALKLGLNDEAANWSALDRSLHPLFVDGKTGSMMVAENIPMAESHRHFSHMMAIHPLGWVNVDNNRKLVLDTLNETIRQGTQAWTGYSFSWMACALARAGDGERSLDFLHKYLKFTLRNGFHCNGDQSGTGLSGFTYRPFTLEGNFLAMEAVHEMLLQSWGGNIRKFPAMPKSWQGKVEFRNLRAEGGKRISGKG
jgi:alpha-L-fucosidase 2